MYIKNIYKKIFCIEINKKQNIFFIHTFFTCNLIDICYRISIYGQFQPVIIIYEEALDSDRDGGQFKINLKKSQSIGDWSYRSVGKVDNG